MQLHFGVTRFATASNCKIQQGESMSIPNKFFKFQAVASSLILTLSMLLPMIPTAVFAECKEFNLVEYEDRIEAVCVGEPLTAAQKQALADEDKRQELEAKRRKTEEERRQKEAETADAKKNAQAVAEQKKQEAKPTATKQNQNSGRVNLQKF
jgi:flagellar biosynthesis GTPase FlhF